MEYIEVEELREFIKDLPGDMKIYITSNDEMPIRKIIDITTMEYQGYYKELYLETVDAGSQYK